MVANRRVTGTASSIPVGIGIGTAVSLLITLVGGLITAWLIDNEMIAEEAIGYSAMIILMVASIAGAFTSNTMVKHQRLIICALSAASYYLSLIAITAMFFGGAYQGMGVSALVVASGAAVVILQGLKNGNGIKAKKYRYG